ncbi:MAG: hypothetical protein KGD57_07365 [Candidatus Lokiarchaeota archaeon]|nr:hypothetical protein [Candidatus Lokiarchaeota archaeon]
MSLDKWLNSEEKKAKEKKKQDNTKEIKIEIENNKKSKKFKKFILKCPESKCNYQKTILKNALSETDKICPRCRYKMKINEI